MSGPGPVRRGDDASVAAMVRAVAVDFDGTLTEGGAPPEAVLRGLARFRGRGGRVVLATGRVLDELATVFPSVGEATDAVVAENGGILAVDGRVRELSAPVEPDLDGPLRHRGVPFRRGRILLATGVAHAAAVQEEVTRLGLDCQLVRNRDELMVLPVGCTKGSGVLQALAELGLSRHNAVAVGDAENDHSMFERCELGVAVANAVPALRRQADHVTPGRAGVGVLEVLDGTTLAGLRRTPPGRWCTALGTGVDGRPVTIPLAHANLLVAGPSGSGKSWAAGLLAEGAVRLGYTVLVIDPEGDYAQLGTLPDVVVVGGTEPLPALEHIVALLRQLVSVVVDLSLRPAAEREWFLSHAPALLEAQWSASGVPHWVLVDEAHGPLGAAGAARRFFSADRPGRCVVTYQPEELCDEVLDALDAVVLLPGSDPDRVPGVGGATDRRPGVGPEVADVGARLDALGPGEALLVEGPALRAEPVLGPVRLARRETAHARHWHKYVSHFLPAELRFYFRDEDGDAGPPAANLAEFHGELVRCTAGVLRHHAARADFSRWIRDVFRDHELAEVIEAAERHVVDGPPALAETGRRRLLLAIEHRYLRP